MRIPEGPGDVGGRSDAEAHRESPGDKNHRKREAHRREGGRSELSDEEGIVEVEQHYAQGPRNHGEEETKEGRPNSVLYHIRLFHGYFLP